jgi:hypothetical protein
MSVAPALTTDHKKNTPSQVYIGTKWWILWDYHKCQK